MFEKVCMNRNFAQIINKPGEGGWNNNVLGEKT